MTIKMPKQSLLNKLTQAVISILAVPMTHWAGKFRKMGFRQSPEPYPNHPPRPVYSPWIDADDYVLENIKSVLEAVSYHVYSFTDSTHQQSYLLAQRNNEAPCEIRNHPTTHRLVLSVTVEIDDDMPENQAKQFTASWRAMSDLPTIQLNGNNFVVTCHLPYTHNIKSTDLIFAVAGLTGYRDRIGKMEKAHIS